MARYELLLRSVKDNEKVVLRRLEFVTTEEEMKDSTDNRPLIDHVFLNDIDAWQICQDLYEEIERDLKARGL